MWGEFDWGDDTALQWQIGLADAMQQPGDLSSTAAAAEPSGGGGGSNYSWLTSLGAALMDTAAIMQGRPATNLQQMQRNRLERQRLAIAARKQLTEEGKLQVERDRISNINTAMASLDAIPSAGVPSQAAPVAPYPAPAPSGAYGYPPMGGTPQVDENGNPYPLIPLDDVTGDPSAGFVPGHGALETPQPINPVTGMPAQQSPVGGIPPGGPAAGPAGPPVGFTAGMPPEIQRMEAQAQQYEQVAQIAAVNGNTPLANTLMRKAEDLRTVSLGTFARMGPQGRQLVADYRKAMSPTASPTTKIINDLRQKEQTLTDRMRMQTAEEMAADFRKQRSGALEAAQTAARMSRMVAGGQTPMGAYAPLVTQFARYVGGDPLIKSIWGENADLSSAQLFDSQAGEMVLDTLKRVPGALSEGELAFWREINPSLGKEPFANFAQLQLYERAMRRRQGLIFAFEDYLESNRPLRDFEDWFLNDPEARRYNPWAGEQDPMTTIKQDWAIARRGLSRTPPRGR